MTRDATQGTQPDVYSHCFEYKPDNACYASIRSEAIVAADSGEHAIDEHRISIVKSTWQSR
jgi:hypothetical protein